MKLKNDKALETYRIFPYIAWGVTILFAVFVYNITRELQAITSDLQKQTQYLQERIDTPTHEITDFSKPTTSRSR